MKLWNINKFSLYQVSILRISILLCICRCPKPFWSRYFHQGRTQLLLPLFSLVRAKFLSSFCLAHCVFWDIQVASDKVPAILSTSFMQVYLKCQAIAFRMKYQVLLLFLQAGSYSSPERTGALWSFCLCLPTLDYRRVPPRPAEYCYFLCLLISII